MMRRSLPLKHTLGALALAMVLTITLVHLYTNVLGGSVGARPTHVTVAMDQTGGLFEGSGVTYRGVRIGSVDAIRLRGDHVEARLSLDPGARVPADAEAVVRTLSPAGEQFIDLQPARSGGPYLAEGARISADRTDTPASVAETLASVDRLMGQVDETDLRTVLDEASTALSDSDDLGRVVAAGSDLVDTLDSVWPETLRTLQNGRTVLRTGVDTADEFTSFAASARGLTAWLEDYDPTLRSTLDAAPGQLVELQRLADDMVVALPPLLRDFAAFTDVFARRDPHVRELLVQFPTGLARLADAFTGGRMQTNMLVSPGTVCSYGVPESNPQSTVRTGVAPDRSCPESFDGQQRGSAHTPPPTR